ncbi:TetR/AcrR family transcriptional regulator [Rhodococcus sp. NPDC057014]|uniref:TetR/AcrR family transcriptional regulator n=1 Tax=Rhodococcus sp. NPDC057014 TaxID=3346000 RepID=UPI00364302CA
MAQHSNRSTLVEGAIRCLETLPPEAITARVIAAESGANLASISYHFGSKDGLLAEAMAESFRRWETEVVSGIADLPDSDIAVRLERAIGVVLSSMPRYTGLLRTFYAAVARAPHDERVRQPLAESYSVLRSALAAEFGLGADDTGNDAAGIVMAIFDGLLVQALLDPSQLLDPERVAAAVPRLFGSTRTHEGGSAATLSANP